MGDVAPTVSLHCLLIAAMPYWERKLISVDAGIGDTAEFHCKATGIPAPDIFWFINGVPIASKWRRLSAAKPGRPYGVMYVLSLLTSWTPPLTLGPPDSGAAKIPIDNFH